MLVDLQKDIDYLIFAYMKLLLSIFFSVRRIGRQIDRQIDRFAKS